MIERYKPAKKKKPRRKKRSGVNGKQKGGSFERKICKALSLWVTAGAHEDCFWRSAMSGGRATVGSRKGKTHARHAGDISATSPEGHKLTEHFYVECKHYKSLDYDLFLFGKGNLYKFWKTTQVEAQKYNKTPMLIARQNRVETMVLSELGCFVEFCGGTEVRVAGADLAVLFPLKKLTDLPFEELYAEL